MRSHIRAKKEIQTFSSARGGETIPGPAGSENMCRDRTKGKVAIMVNERKCGIWRGRVRRYDLGWDLTGREGVRLNERECEKECE